MIFNSTTCISIEQVWRVILKTLKSWEVLMAEHGMEKMACFLEVSAKHSQLPLMILSG